MEVKRVKFYTTGDIARLVGVSAPTIRSYISKKILVPDRVLPSGRVQFSEETVQKFLKSMESF